MSGLVFGQTEASNRSSPLEVDAEIYTRVSSLQTLSKLSMTRRETATIELWKYENLVRRSLHISPIMLGGNVFGWTADEATSFRILDAFVDRGFNVVDTADVYTAWVPGHSGGESETVIGKWFAQSGKRDKVVLATKVGMEVRGQKGLSKDHILRSAEESLRRLQTDRIDLYQSHRDDPDTNFEETLSAYAQLIKEGKVRAIGASNYRGDRLTQAFEVAKNGNLPAYCSLQPLYNLYDREDYETNLEPVVKAWNLGVVPYYALAAGFLTGKYRSEADLQNRARGTTVQKYLNERGHRILAALDKVARGVRIRLPPQLLSPGLRPVLPSPLRLQAQQAWNSWRRS